MVRFSMLSGVLWYPFDRVENLFQSNVRWTFPLTHYSRCKKYTTIYTYIFPKGVCVLHNIRFQFSSGCCWNMVSEIIENCIFFFLFHILMTPTYISWFTYEISTVFKLQKKNFLPYVWFWVSNWYNTWIIGYFR